MPASQKYADANLSRRQKLWAGMDYLTATLHDAGLHPSDMTDIIEWWAAWTRDPEGTPYKLPTPKPTRITPCNPRGLRSNTCRSSP